MAATNHAALIDFYNTYASTGAKAAVPATRIFKEGHIDVVEATANWKGNFIIISCDDEPRAVTNSTPCGRYKSMVDIDIWTHNESPGKIVHDDIMAKWFDRSVVSMPHTFRNRRLEVMLFKSNTALPGDAEDNIWMHRVQFEMNNQITG